MTIQIDLYSDWIEYQKTFLLKLGYPVTGLSAPTQISIAYFNAIKRRVTRRKRKVFKSDVFSCPSHLKKGLQELEGKIKGVHDINPHLSRSLKKANYNDQLLNDWGILHFHLGCETEDDGFIKREGPVLFGCITHDSFYAINVYNHGNWSNTDLIEIIHKNWPYLLEKFRLDDVIGIAYLPDSKIIKQFRNNKINSFVQVMDGTIYSQPGLGYTTSGVAADVSVATIRYKKFMISLQGLVLEDLANEIENELVKLGHTKGEKIELRLLIENGWSYVYCDKYKIKFKLYAMNCEPIS